MNHLGVRFSESDDVSRGMERRLGRSIPKLLKQILSAEQDTLEFLPINPITTSDQLSEATEYTDELIEAWGGNPPELDDVRLCPFALDRVQVAGTSVITQLLKKTFGFFNSRTVVMNTNTRFLSG